MADVHDKATRSYNMSHIKGKNTKPEMLVRRFLHAHGYRYRLHDKKPFAPLNILINSKIYVLPVERIVNTNSAPVFISEFKLITHPIAFAKSRIM